MQLNIGEVVTGPATPVRHHHKSLYPLPTFSPSSDQTSDDSTFNVLQLNANGIGNKLTELGVVMENNKVKVAVIQESKLPSNRGNPCIQS